MRGHGKIDDPRLGVAELRTTVLANLVELADETGLSCEPWFAGLRLDRAQISDATTRVSYRQAALIVQRAVQSMPPGIGLQLGSRPNAGNFGLLSLAMMSAPTFGDAMQIGLAYSELSGTLMDLELEAPSSTTVAMLARQLAPDPLILPFLCEELFATSTAMARDLIGPEFRLHGLELAYPPPAYAADYDALFDCPVRFGMPYNRAVIDRHWLQVPLPGRNPMHAQQVLALCREQLSRQDSPAEIVATVGRLLRTRLHENPRLAEISAALHLTERTLRRHLGAAGTGYSELHDRVRSERAIELLHDRTLTIAQVGAAVGFKDVREFRRAFKRWTGASPSAMRA
ncbi:MAG TPA: AraC family transcriptional regulator [Lysobacter sp.]